MNEQKKLRSIPIRERLYERRFLLPNAVTVGNLFCGFISIIYSASDRYEKAVIAIILAMLLDGLDGRVARRFNATSKFGVEFDSFSDLISFGVAPAILMYHWAFRPIADEFGVFISFVYILCAAFRLIRFNITEINLKSFDGLASPAGAALVAALVNLSPRAEPGNLMFINAALLMLAVSYLMVSKIPYKSIKILRLDRLGPFSIVLIGMLIALIWYAPRTGFMALAMIYALSGLVVTLFPGLGRSLPVNFARQ